MTHVKQLANCSLAFSAILTLLKMPKIDEPEPDIEAYSAPPASISRLISASSGNSAKTLGSKSFLTTPLHIATLAATSFSRLDVLGAGVTRE